MSSIKQSALDAAFRHALDTIPVGAEMDGGKVKKIGNDLIAHMLVTYFGDRLIWDNAIGAFWLYDPRGFFMAVTNEDMMLKTISGFLIKRHQYFTTTSKLKDIFKQTQLHAPTVDELDDDYVSFADVVWSPITGKTAIPEPTKIATVHIPAKFADIANAPSPMLDKFIKETCVDEEGNFNQGIADQLQEFAGYLLWPRLQRVPCVFLYGTGHNGKSVYIDILKGLVGKDKTACCGLEDLMGDKFGIVSLAGMRFNASDEMGNCRAATTEKFKKMIVGDAISAQRKFGPAFMMKPNCRFVFSTNTIPAFSEVNLAMKRRLLVIPFYRDLNPFDHGNKKFITENLGEKIIRDELPGVVRWAMGGLVRLRTNEFWMTQTTISDTLMNELEAASSSVAEFLQDKFEPDPDGEFHSTDAYEEYVGWTKEVGRKAVSRLSFGKDFVAVFGKSKQIRRGSSVLRVYKCRRKNALLNLGDHL